MRQSTILLIPLLLFGLGSAAQARTGSGFWKILDNNEEIGIYGFAFDELANGYRFSAGEGYFADAQEQASFEHVDVVLDKDLKIQTLNYQAFQGAEYIHAQGTLQGKKIILRKRQGDLPATRMELPTNISMRELPLFRYIHEQDDNIPATGKTFPYIEFMTGKIGSAAVELTTTANQQTMALITNTGRGNQLSKFMLGNHAKSSLDFNNLHIQGMPVECAVIARAEFENLMNSEFLAAIQEEQNLSAAKISKLLEEAEQANAERLLLIQIELAVLDKDLLATAQLYRGQTLTPRQKLILVAALAELGTPEAQKEYLVWFDLLDSQEQIMAIRKTADINQATSADLLFSLLIRMDRQLEQEIALGLDRLATKMETEKLASVLTFHMENYQFAEKSSSVPLFRYAVARQIAIAATTWLDRLKATKDQEKIDLLHLVGKSPIQGDAGEIHALVSAVRATLMNSRELKELVASAGAAARLHDEDSIGMLVELLEREDMASIAHLALQEITGLKFPLQVQRWQTWWQQEEIRYQDELPQTLNQLFAEDSAARLAAISALPRYTLGKEQIHRALAQLREDPDQEIRNAADTMLEKLTD